MVNCVAIGIVDGKLLAVDLSVIFRHLHAISIFSSFLSRFLTHSPPSPYLFSDIFFSFFTLSHQCFFVVSEYSLLSDKLLFVLKSVYILNDTQKIKQINRTKSLYRFFRPIEIYIQSFGADRQFLKYSSTFFRGELNIAVKIFWTYSTICCYCFINLAAAAFAAATVVCMAAKKREKKKSRKTNRSMKLTGNKMEIFKTWNCTKVNVLWYKNIHDLEWVYKWLR